MNNIMHRDPRLPGYVPEGRSYHVVAFDAAIAKRAARDKACAEGHPGALSARVLHVERVVKGVYEVVLEVPHGSD